MQQLLVVFAADYPDDALWNEQGDLQIPGGRHIADLIANSLRSVGKQCSEVSQRSFYGWQFSIETDSSSALAVLQQSTEWLLVLGANESLLDWLGGKRSSEETLQQLAVSVKAVLEKDEHISNVRVMKEKEYEVYLHERPK
jgi:hypothetical protein